jgi:hypothetical protein
MSSTFNEERLSDNDDMRDNGGVEAAEWAYVEV